MNWRRSVIGAAIALPVIALLGYGMTRDPRAIPSPLPGRAAPSFALAVFSQPSGARVSSARRASDTVRLADLRGKVVVLNFWASWCLACRAEHAVLSDVASALASDTLVRFYGVLYSDQADNGRDWIAEMGGQSYPGLLDPSSRTAIDYGLYGVPETFFIGKDGRVSSKFVGPVTEDVLYQRIRALESASPPLAERSP